MSKIFDFHAHIFPEKIASKAAGATGEYYGIAMKCGGTAGELLSLGRTAGISGYLVHSTATTPRQVVRINDYVANETAKHSEFIGFGTLHPFMEDIGSEIDRIISLGLRGIKLHPDFQQFDIDDPAAMTMYEALAGRLPVLFHCGDVKCDHSHPRRLRQVIDTFSSLTVIGAHFAGYSVWTEAAEILGCRGDFYVDTSSSLKFLPSEYVRELIAVYGEDRVLFGSDYPMWDYTDELARFEALGLSDAVADKILWGNAANLLGL